MASVKICDGRMSLWQYDTGVKIEMCGCSSVTECHFVTGKGVIRRDVTDNICDVPDAALVTAGMLVVYAFARTADEGTTRHEFRVNVQARPKPADYIDPPDEIENLDALAERVAIMIEPEPHVETDPTVPDWAKQPEKPTYTAQEVGAQPAGDYALKSELHAPYSLPTASADTLGGVKVGEGLQMTGDVLGVVPEGVYELIDTITFAESAVLNVTQEPNGTPYKFSRMMLLCNAPAGDGNPEDVSFQFPGTSGKLPVAWGGDNTKAIACYGECYVQNGFWRTLWGTNTNFYVWDTVLVGYNRITGYPQYDYVYRYISGLKSSAAFRAGSVLKIYGIRYKGE